MKTKISTTFQRLARFENPEGKVFYGEASPVTDPEDLVGKTIPVFHGELWDADFRRSDRLEEVKTVRLSKVLCPLPEVPIFHCVGLNYRHHIEESKHQVPSVPATFNKPPDALAGPLEEIPIHPESSFIDYEGEMSVVIGKDCKDLGQEDNPLDYVLGYTVGNDISSRYWQAPEQSSLQAGYAKSFDKFAPIGPFICSAADVSNPNNLRLTTKVNGELRQDARTDDLLFDIAAIIRHLCRGRTIRKGTVIMTGTPSGVAAFMNPPPWLKHGDVVEVEIEKIGIIRNKFIYKD